MTTDNSNNDSSSLDNDSSSSDDALENITDIEKYFLHGKGEIVQKLRLLSKSKSALTAYFNNGSDFFLTAVVDVLRDKNILVLDITKDKELVSKLTQSEHTVFKTKHLGITAQFTVKSILTAKFQGQQFLACEIPEELLWVQRRENFRVQIPLSSNALCQLKNDNELSEYRIIDVSGGGIAIADKNFTLNVEAGDEFNNINLIFSDDLNCTTNLTVQNTLPLNFSEPSAGQRIGCMFGTLSADFASDLQRYINLIDSHYRKTIED